MNGPLVLTFAELEFVIKTLPEPAAVRTSLGLDGEAMSETVFAAGLASLLARGLCVVKDGDVVPESQVIGVAAAFVSSRLHVQAAGQTGSLPVAMHVFAAPSVRLAVFPAKFGQFVVELLDPVEPLSAPLTRFLDSCLSDNAETAVVIRSTAGDDVVAMAVAVDGSGTWYISDSVESPDRGVVSSRAGAASRIVELFDASTSGISR
jgi:hypothetical protein